MLSANERIPDPETTPTTTSSAKSPECRAVEPKASARTVTVGEPDAERLYRTAFSCIVVGAVAVHWIARLSLDEVRARRAERRRARQR
ncbi:hypothetical protein [Saccharopolyspora phatthalungensis]|uniref:Uncharacterized protein n=1 Tax=Saccharopolyspora phatthalungensis TaxID=664693 RepID=A0A840QDJ9_9PSEU|nr:hypothetical protein [Saccharopolyspora phatthalungensis]MBB5156728.1 hypothetical protein [Saccharopolyspora phatthalungensis]